MRKQISTLCAIATVVAALAAPAVANAGPALDALRSSVTADKTTEDAVLAVYTGQLGSDSARIKAVQAELGQRQTGSLTSGDTLARLRTHAASVARANADHAAATARSTAALPPLGGRGGSGAAASSDGDDGETDGDGADGDTEGVSLKPFAKARRLAMVTCNPGTQIVWLSRTKFKCDASPQYEALARLDEDNCELGEDRMLYCDPEIRPPAGREEALPPQLQPPPAVKAKNGFCSSTACKVAVVGGALALGGTGVYLAIPAFSDRLSVPF